MNILVTGKSGFIAQSIKKSYLNNKYNINFIGRNDISLLSKSCIGHVLEKNRYDVIFHTAISGGKRGDDDNISTLDNNLRMFLNLAEAKTKKCKLINFCSGAAFDRRKPIIATRESSISEAFPTDYYGLSKNIIANYINNFDNSFINIRLFGCFGELENDNRFIKRSINNLKNNKNIVINKNKYMDFLYINDLICVLDFFIQNNLSYKDYNIVYEQKFSLFDIAKKIVKEMHLDEKRIEIREPDLDFQYTGDATRILGTIEKFNYNIDIGIRNMIKYTLV